MADIVIKKTINLGFLGEEYKESFLRFRHLAVSEFGELRQRIDAAGDDEIKSQDVIIGILEDKFIEGIFEGQKVAKEDIKQFDNPTIIKCFELFTGQDIDPKG